MYISFAFEYESFPMDDESEYDVFDFDYVCFVSLLLIEFLPMILLLFYMI